VLSQRTNPFLLPTPCSVTIKTMLMSIQELLNNPNDKSPAQREAYEEFVHNKDLYRRKVKEQAARNIPST